MFFSSFESYSWYLERSDLELGAQANQKVRKSKSWKFEKYQPFTPWPRSYLSSQNGSRLIMTSVMSFWLLLSNTLTRMSKVRWSSAQQNSKGKFWQWPMCSSRHYCHLHSCARQLEASMIGCKILRCRSMRGAHRKWSQTSVLSWPWLRRILMNGRRPRRKTRKRLLIRGNLKQCLRRRRRKTKEQHLMRSLEHLIWHCYWAPCLGWSWFGISSSGRSQYWLWDQAPWVRLEWLWLRPFISPAHWACCQALLCWWIKSFWPIGAVLLADFLVYGSHYFLEWRIQGIGRVIHDGPNCWQLCCVRCPRIRRDSTELDQTPPREAGEDHGWGSSIYIQASGLSVLMDLRMLPTFLLWIFMSLADTTGVFVTVVSTTTGTSSSISGTSTPPVVTSISASNGLVLIFSFLSTAMTAEYLASATGAVKQGFSGTLGRPSTWLSLGKARGEFDISVTPFIEVGGGAFDEPILKSSRAVSCYSGIQGVLNDLPTASKIRAQLLTSGTGFAFAVLYLATSCVKYGRLAEKKPAGVTRASQTPQKGLRLSRRLFKELRLSQSFNGVASSSPEVGLLEMQSSGKASPSLLSLRMERGQRQNIEASVARGLGAGSKLNPLSRKSRAPLLISRSVSACWGKLWLLRLTTTPA